MTFRQKIRGIITVSAWSFIILLISVTACVDNNETPPPAEQFQYGTIVAIQQVKALYSAELVKDYTLRNPVPISGNWAIKGIITASDKKDGNLYKEAYIQDASGGLRLTFNSTSGLYIGDSVIVQLQDLYISDYGDFIQIGSTPYKDAEGDVRLRGIAMDQNVLKLSVNNPTLPDIVTIQQIKSTAWLGKLVTINNVQFTDEEIGKSYAEYALDPPGSANRYLMDCSKNRIIVRSSGYASFASRIIPEKNGSITGIVTIFSADYQLVIRDFSEVRLTGDRCTPGIPPLGLPVETISQDFQSFANNVDLAIPGWQNYPQYGDRLWRNKVYLGSNYAQATAYGSNLTKMVTWLICQPVTISARKILTFQTAKAYWKHTGTNVPVEIYYSTSYNGTNLVTADWVPVNATIAGKSDADYVFINSGDFSLPVENGKYCVIAFRYSGSSTESTTYCVDNIVIRAAK
jgi:hypothetical protein